MRSILFLLFTGMVMFVSCNTNKEPASLTEAFVESLNKQQFELLEPYFPTVGFFKSLEQNGPAQSDTAALKFLAESNRRLKEDWAKISERIKAANLDMTKVEIKESFSTQPFWSKKIIKKIVVYNYGNRNWDDLELVVGELDKKELLLEIPNPGQIFSMKDSALKVSNDARFELEIKKPEFKKTLQDKVEKIIALAKQNKVKEFAENIVYNNAGEAGSPQPGLSSNDSGHVQMATAFIEKINKSLEGCDQLTYGDVNNLNLPDGMWIVIQVKCNKKFIHFAFTKTGDALLLNDVDFISQ